MGSIPSIHITANNHLFLQFREIWWPLLTSLGTKYVPNTRHTVIQNTYAHKTKSKQAKSFKRKIDHWWQSSTCNMSGWSSKINGFFFIFLCLFVFRTEIHLHLGIFLLSAEKIDVYYYDGPNLNIEFSKIWFKWTHKREPCYESWYHGYRYHLKKNISQNIF